MEPHVQIDRVVGTGLHGLHGVLEQVEKQLFKHDGVAVHGGKVRLDGRVDACIELLRLNERKLHRLVDDAFGRERRELRLGLLGGGEARMRLMMAAARWA